MMDAFSLSRDQWDRLVLTDGQGQSHAGVEVIRAFPISDPGHSISLCDHEGHELAYVDSLDELPVHVREMIEAELARREFLPIITRILNDPPDTEPTEWSVETDRGRTSFQLDSEDDVHRNDRNQVTIVDTHGIRYLIPNPRTLDAGSRRVLDRFL
jgi:hypothetical protein